MLYNLPPDPYQALGVPKDVQLPEIRSAYKKLILKCHPDKVHDPQQKAEKQAEFQKVQQAYELLNDEIARSKYDDKVRYNEKYGELEKEKAKRPSSPPSAARTPSRSRPAFYEPEIRTAEPRPSTFAKTGTSPSSRKFYESGFSSSRSFEEVPSSSPRAYDEPRRTKKSASYEREREREWEREQEREKERERLERRKRKDKEAEEYAAREREREREREKEQRDRMKVKEVDDAKKKTKDRRDKDKDKKKADKERKRDTEDKHRRHKHHSEPYHEDSDVDDAVPVFEKKSSSSRKEDATHEGSRQVPTTERERKNSANLESAIRYLERSGAKPALSRSPTYQDTPSYRHVAPPVAAPTPPPATASAHPPPPPPPQARDIDVEEDGARRSSGRSSRTKPPDALRSSARESRDKSSHRKSGTRSASRDAAPRPTIVEVAPGVNRVPAPLQKTYTEPHRVMHLNRSYTESYARPVPHLERQNTWQQGDDHDRSRGRHVTSFSESEDDAAHHYRQSRRTQSPEPMVTPTRYAVASDGKTRRKYTSEAVPIPTPRGHKVKHVMANTSSARGADPGINGYFHQDGYEAADAPTHAAFSSVQYSPVVREDEVQYSNLSRGYSSSSYNKDPYSSTQVY